MSTCIGWQAIDKDAHFNQEAEAAKYLGTCIDWQAVGRGAHFDQQAKVGKVAEHMLCPVREGVGAGGTRGRREVG